jgi:hypothetical protein
MTDTAGVARKRDGDRPGRRPLIGSSSAVPYSAAWCIFPAIRSAGVAWLADICCAGRARRARHMSGWASRRLPLQPNNPMICCART